MICPVFASAPSRRGADGGGPKQVCAFCCRRVLDLAGRLWIRRALANGGLTMAYLLEGQLTHEDGLDCGEQPQNVSRQIGYECAHL